METVGEVIKIIVCGGLLLLMLVYAVWVTICIMRGDQ